jgi:hypothetical protein
MLYRLRLWHVVLPVVLIALLMATTMGMVWHHHARNTADGCTLCHLAIAPAAAGAGVCEPVLEAAEYFARDDGFHPHFAADEMPARAPPA